MPFNVVKTRILDCLAQITASLLCFWSFRTILEAGEWNIRKQFEDVFLCQSGFKVELRGWFAFRVVSFSSGALAAPLTVTPTALGPSRVLFEAFTCDVHVQVSFSSVTALTYVPRVIQDHLLSKWHGPHMTLARCFLRAHRCLPLLMLIFVYRFDFHVWIGIFFHSSLNRHENSAKRADDCITSQRWPLASAEECYKFSIKFLTLRFVEICILFRVCNIVDYAPARSAPKGSRGFELTNASMTGEESTTISEVSLAPS